MGQPIYKKGVLVQARGDYLVYHLRGRGRDHTEGQRPPFGLLSAVLRGNILFQGGRDKQTGTCSVLAKGKLTTRPRSYVARTTSTAAWAPELIRTTLMMTIQANKECHKNRGENIT